MAEEERRTAGWDPHAAPRDPELQRLSDHLDVVEARDLNRLQRELLELAQERISRLEHASETDELTGLLNRRALWRQLDAEVRRARRHHRELAVVMLDIDSLDAVTATKGHLGADSVVTEIARRLAHAVRASDHLGRWGGDEFLVICPETDEPAAAATGARLAELVSAEPVVVSGWVTRVTLSAGAGSLADRSPSEAIEAADRALYRGRLARGGPEASTSSGG